MSTELHRFRYHRLLQSVSMEPWAVLPSHLAKVQDVLSFQANGGKLSANEVAELVGLGSQPARVAAAGSIAVLSMRGTIAHRIESVQSISGSGGTSIEGFRSRFQSALADPNVSAIVVDVDSPGGSVAGVRELADEVFAARGRKPMVAVANTLAASAAFWLASAFQEFSVTDSGQVGSVGVFAMHENVSAALERQGVEVTLVHAGKYKTEGTPFAALGDEARAHLQERVDVAYGQFVNALARNRSVSKKHVESDFGQGRVVDAKDAVDRGMADRVETIEEVIQRLGGRSAPRRRRMSAALAAAGVYQSEKRNER